jgi:hypothetical protein
MNTKSNCTKATKHWSIIFTAEPWLTPHIGNSQASQFTQFFSRDIHLSLAACRNQFIMFCIPKRLQQAQSDRPPRFLELPFISFRLLTASLAQRVRCIQFSFHFRHPNAWADLSQYTVSKFFSQAVLHGEHPWPI